eukprot:gene2556-3967_t
MAGCAIQDNVELIRGIFDLCDASGDGFITAEKAVEIGDELHPAEADRVRSLVAGVAADGLVSFDSVVEFLEPLGSLLKGEDSRRKLELGWKRMREDSRQHWIQSKHLRRPQLLSEPVTIEGLYKAAKSSAGGLLTRSKLEPLIAALSPQLSQRERRRVVSIVRTDASGSVPLSEIVAILGQAPEHYNSTASAASSGARGTPSPLALNHEPPPAPPPTFDARHPQFSPRTPSLPLSQPSEAKYRVDGAFGGTVAMRHDVSPKSDSSCRDEYQYLRLVQAGGVGTPTHAAYYSSDVSGRRAESRGPAAGESSDGVQELLRRCESLDEGPGGGEGVAALLRENDELRGWVERLRLQLNAVATLKADRAPASPGIEERCAELEAMLAACRADRNAAAEAHAAEKAAFEAEVHALSAIAHRSPPPPDKRDQPPAPHPSAGSKAEGTVPDRALKQHHEALRQEAAEALQPGGYQRSVIYQLVTSYDELVVSYDKRLADTRSRLHQHVRRVQQAEAEFIRLASTVGHPAGRIGDKRRDPRQQGGPVPPAHDPASPEQRALRSLLADFPDRPSVQAHPEKLLAALGQLQDAMALMANINRSRSNSPCTKSVTPSNARRSGRSGGSFSPDSRGRRVAYDNLTGYFQRLLASTGQLLQCPNVPPEFLRDQMRE